MSIFGENFRYLDFWSKFDQYWIFGQHFYFWSNLHDCTTVRKLYDFSSKFRFLVKISILAKISTFAKFRFLVKNVLSELWVETLFLNLRRMGSNPARIKLFFVQSKTTSPKTVRKEDSSKKKKGKAPRKWAGEGKDKEQPALDFSEKLPANATHVERTPQVKSVAIRSSGIFAQKFDILLANKELRLFSAPPY